MSKVEDVIEREELLSRLERLLPAQFERVLFYLRIASSQLAGVNAPQSIRAVELLRHLENTGELARLDLLLSSYDSAAEVSGVSAQPSAAATPVPVYPDAEVKALSLRLENARARKQRLHDSGIKAEDLDREILELRRQLREGGQLRAGDTLSDGRYLLVKVVGRGGFAVVWEAYDCIGRQRVAIKVLHSNLAGDPQRRERFFRGARVMTMLAHPAVVRVLEPYGEDGSFYYFVMEFIAGGNLREAVLAQRVKKAELLPLILQVGRALALAHDRRMVHRDVKPSNILLDENGAPKLTDFDLVGAQDTTGGTRTGALGTIVYAAPECLDRPQEATARADVYGLGMTAIFCLHGRDLSMDTLRNPERLISRLDCSIQVQKVLRQAVKWEPGERFFDAATMMSALYDAEHSADGGDAEFEFLADSIDRPYPVRREQPAREVMPALTIVSHPMLHRAGHRALLPGLAAGRQVSLSRSDLRFWPPGDPLDDPYVSSKPIRFAPDPGGGVRVFVDTGSTPVVARAPVDGSAVFTAEEIAHGVTLELAERIVLLLHQVDDRIEDTIDGFGMIGAGIRRVRTGMIGASAGIRRVRTAIERVADLAVPVLIRGETGSGKELAARAIHACSQRSTGPFVSVNLAAVPRELAVIELFGSTRGAYTGARDRDGLFLAAHGGTLFLDEVGEAPHELQVMLLRVLETGEIYPVGAEKPVATNVRLIAATDTNLPLLNPLAGFEIRIPPLRERREDIGLLFYHFAREELEALGESHRLAPQDHYARPWLPAHVAAQLVRHNWPGNVRELRNLTRQLVIESRGLSQLQVDPRIADQLGVVARPGEEPPARPSRPAIEIRRKASDVTEDELQDALRACGWDLKAAADRLRIPRPSIYDLIELSPRTRTAGDLDADEIKQCFQDCAGDLDVMVARLHVSRRALSRRLRELGLVHFVGSQTP